MTRRKFATIGVLLLGVLVTVPGSARQQQTEILWDTWGVPHIYAATESEAFRAFGFALRWRRTAT